MNKEETLALSAQGMDAWNSWASGLLAEKMKLESAGRWSAEPLGNWNPHQSAGGRNKETRAWFALADFSDVEFTDQIVLDGFVFPGPAFFENTKFAHNAFFNDVRFESSVTFEKAIFRGDTQFDNALFKEAAWFVNGAFRNDTLFTSATFHGAAVFTSSIFAGQAVFTGAQFLGGGMFMDTRFIALATFERIRVDRGFSLVDARFSITPNFNEASFREPPRLDELSIAPYKFWLSLFRSQGSESFTWQTFRYGSDGREVQARYRVLRKLAVDAGDHERELDFFAGEIRARRIVIDKPWHWRYWLGVCYEILSDVGRSAVRPLVWWILLTLTFVPVYLGPHFKLHDSVLPPGAYGETVCGWLLRTMGALCQPFAPWMEERKTAALTCLNGLGDPFLSALFLSIKGGLILVGWEQSEKVNQALACLYGIQYETAKLALPAALPRDLPDQFVAVIPDVITFAGFGQMILSAILLFLLVLAVRNHFRIR